MLLAKLNNNYKRSLKESEKIPSSNCNALTDQELTLQKKKQCKANTEKLVNLKTILHKIQNVFQ